ncbi:hypothetical protein QT972_00225 [Microcoleus sp. herbarium7]|uniref:hypothetical protein n=1 Tax=Microcoleus sp. herbarium7 TaxID=3055435 RepID=UPI002FD264E1
MPTQFATATVTATTITDADETKIVRNRHAIGSGQVSTAGTALGFARDRHIAGMEVRSAVVATAIATRERIVRAVSILGTSTECDRVASMPVQIAPQGKLFLNGMPFATASFQKDQSLQIRFEISGRKLLNLRAAFKLFDLQGKLLTGKLETIAPGGLETDTETVKADGLTNYIGYIFLDRTETLFLDAPKEFEVEYEFEIGNSRLNHPIERGFITFAG